MRSSAIGFVALLTSLVACGGSQKPPAVPSGDAALTTPPNPPALPSSAATVAGDPFTLPAGPRDELAPPSASAVKLDAFDAAIKTKGLAAPAVTCAAFARRAPASPAAADMVTALGTSGADKIDAALVSLEPFFDAKEPGLVRALRADLAPACADVIVDPYLAKHRDLTSRAAPVLVGLSLAAKLDRTGANAPQMPATIVEKEKIKAFINGPLKAWMVQQSTAIETLSGGGAGLTGYGRGIAATSAGQADLRLVSVIRNSPLPPKWDSELVGIYQAALDEALEPRKRRGRDAALVGLADMANTGNILDVRVFAVEQLLGQLYGGRRIDALRGLLLPAAADPAPASPLQTAERAVSPYWQDTFSLFGAADRDIQEALVRGTSLHVRDLFASPDAAKLRPETRTSYARARLELGFTFWRRVDFVEAAYAASPGKTPEDRFYLALALALAQGPNGAAEMMRAASPSALDLQHTEALDAVSAEIGPYAGDAAFAAAHLRSLSPPDGADVGPYFRDVAARFRKAETLLTDATKKNRAHQRAAEIDAILATLDKK